MPKVGSKKFAYDKSGVKKAKAYAKKTGKKVEVDNSFMARMMRGMKKGK